MKRFPAARADDAAVEAAVLTAVRRLKLAPLLRAVQRDEDGGVTLVLDALAGRAWPRHASPALAAALGRQLARLHGAAALPPLPQLGARDAGRLARLPGGPAAHAEDAARALAGRPALPEDVRARLVPFLEANGAGLAPGPTALCHADLKPENLRVAGTGVWLFDFERAFLADPAWELACAMDRLGLDAAGRQALLEGWSAERADAEVAVRAQLFRLAWQVALPVAVASLRRDTGRAPSPRARQLARDARRRAKRLLGALASVRQPRAAAWAEENAEAFEAYNRFVARAGIWNEDERDW